MKKRILLVIATITMVTVSWNYQQSKQYEGMSELALANVEALARYELPDFEVNCGSQESISSFLLFTIFQQRINK